jgi:integrase
MATFQQRAGNWRAIITRKGYPRQSRTFDLKADAEKWARDIERDMDRGVFVCRKEAERTTLAEALERYEREVTPAKKGAAQERLRIRAWKADPLAQRSLAFIRSSDLAAWRDKRLAGGTSPTTARNDLAVISHLFNVAAREWGMESLTNPVEKIKMPLPARARDRRLDPRPDSEGRTEEVRLLSACDAGPHWLGPIVRLALATAMRQGELLSLEWGNIDLTRKVAKLDDTKNGERREVPLFPAALTVVEALPRNISGKAFTIGTMAVVHAFQRACKRADIVDLRFHDLRHEAASRLFEAGFNPMEVATVTGHKTLQMLKRYTHLRAEDLAKRMG